MPMKYTRPCFLVVAAAPTNTSSGSTPSPGVPKPILTVDKPIKSSFNFATNKSTPSGRFADAPNKLALARFVDIPIESPVFRLYLTLSPVLNL